MDFVPQDFESVAWHRLGPLNRPQLPLPSKERVFSVNILCGLVVNDSDGGSSCLVGAAQPL